MALSRSMLCARDQRQSSCWSGPLLYLPGIRGPDRLMDGTRARPMPAERILQAPVGERMDELRVARFGSYPSAGQVGLTILLGGKTSERVAMTEISTLT